MAGIRYEALDVLRGLAVLNMVVYHLLWDLVYIFGFDWAWYEGKGAYIWQQVVCWIFILLSGFCSSFGHRKLRRGAIVFFMGFLMYVVTAVVMPENCIRFGILTLLGSCMILMTFLEKILRKVRPFWGIFGGIFFFVLSRNINQGYLGFERWNLIALPKEWYRNLLSTYLGFKMPGFVSADYFSLLPWAFLFVTGFYLHELFVKKQWMNRLKADGGRPLQWLGRHSLEIYVVHQPVIYLGLLAAGF